MTSAKRILGASGLWVILLGVLSMAGLAHGQTSQVQILSLDGARTLLHATEQKAQQLSAPSSLAVVDAAGDLILFEQMEGARPIGIDLAIGKARSAARFRETTQALEAAIDGQVDYQKGNAALFQYEIQNGADPDLKAFAHRTLPKIEDHLQLALKLAKSGAAGASTQ